MLFRSPSWRVLGLRLFRQALIVEVWGRRGSDTQLPADTVQPLLPLLASTVAANQGGHAVLSDADGGQGRGDAVAEAGTAIPMRVSAKRSAAAHLAPHVVSDPAVGHDTPSIVTRTFGSESCTLAPKSRHWPTGPL